MKLTATSGILKVPPTVVTKGHLVGGKHSWCYNSVATHDAGKLGWKTVALGPSFVLQSPAPTL